MLGLALLLQSSSNCHIFFEQGTPEHPSSSTLFWVWSSRWETWKSRHERLGVSQRGRGLTGNSQALPSQTEGSFAFRLQPALLVSALDKHHPQAPQYDCYFLIFLQFNTCNVTELIWLATVSSMNKSNSFYPVSQPFKIILLELPSSGHSLLC